MPVADSIVGRWAQDKLSRLGKYLHAYTTIMKEQSWCRGYYYIDAFAGPGTHEIRSPAPRNRKDAKQALLDVAAFRDEDPDQREFIDGSPRVALDLENPFTHYFFVELSKDRVAALRKLRDEYANSRSIHIRPMDCTKYLKTEVAETRKIDWNEHRAFVFLDPFGMQVGWETIKALGHTGAIEILLNFPVGMAIQRLLLRQPEKFSAAQRQRLDRYFGSSSWMDAIYKKEKTLFGDEELEKVEKSGKALVNWYRDQLKTVFPYVSRAALIRNSRGGHLYYLILASPKNTGARIFNDILSEGEFV